MLGAIAQITQVHDSELMRQRFAENLAQLFPIAAMRFLTPGPNDRLNEPLSCAVQAPPAQPQLLWDRVPRRGIQPSGALARCLAERRHMYPAQSHNLDYFPILDQHGILEIIEIRQLQRAHAERSMLASVLQIYGNFLRILHEREIDPLTRLLNRGAFDAHLTLTAKGLHDRARPATQDSRWWLLMIDVDHFKSVNDRFGHPVGDAVLRRIARLMWQSFRGTDRLYRYGGEEFAILLSPCTRAAALRSAERFRSLVEHTPFPQVGRMTVSAGLAPINGQQDHPANLIGRADQALYRAKQQGRNRINECPGSRRPGLSGP